MALTIKALSAFKAKGYRIDSRIKGKKAIKLMHATFSGYIKDVDAIADVVRDFIERGAIVQLNPIKGYSLFSYPDNDDGRELFNDFKATLTDTGNYLRFIGYSDRMIVSM